MGWLFGVTEGEAAPVDPAFVTVTPARVRALEAWEAANPAESGIVPGSVVRVPRDPHAAFWAAVEARRAARAGSAC